MDIAIAKKSPLRFNKLYLALALLLIPLFLGAKQMWYLSQAGFSVDREALVISEVKRGKYTVSVRGTGLMVPDVIQWLSANVEATVVRRVVKAGNTVKTGDLIVELANPQLQQQLVEAKWELEAMTEEFKAAKVDQEAALQQQRSIVLNAKLDYEKSVNEFNAHDELIKTGAVSRLAYERTRVEMGQAKQRWIAAQEQMAKMEENLVAQARARDARLNQTQKMVERIQQQVDDLQVKATMDSIVLEVPVEEGQRLMMGANIAKLARQDSLIAELQVPEILIRDVAVGQRVLVDTRNNKIEGVVTRVDPAVISGHVQVDVAFEGDLPDDARPDLSVNGEIKITEIDDALYVNRPLFSQSRSSAALYKVTEDGDFARRVPVMLGYGSVNQIQVLEGLAVGDKIVTSDPTRFESHDKFRIN